jgi:hypothetical protein
MSMPYLMLRDLVPGQMTADERRQADEQLGRLAAAATRRGRRVAGQVHALAARARHQPAAFRKDGSPRRRAPYRA